MNYKNYLEHEIKVKWGDGILEQSQDWQWFIDYLEEYYDLSDIVNYVEFESRRYYASDIVGYFIKILEICSTEYSSQNKVLDELFNIAKYYIGIIDSLWCIQNIETEFGKLLFVLVWLTKLENADNSTNYVVDFRFFNEKNFHQAIRMDLIEDQKEDIIKYLEQIHTEGFDIAKKNILDNLNRISYGVTEKFFEKYGDNMWSANAFRYQTVPIEVQLSWQERTLLDMLKISIKDGKISPMFSDGKSTVPEYSRWTTEKLIKLQKYFTHYIADFVIETVDFVLNQKVPSLNTIESHCKFLTNLIKNEIPREIFSSSSYAVVKLLFDTGVMDDICKTDDIRELYKTIHNVLSTDLLMKLQGSFPLNNKQKSMIKEFITTQYRSVLEIGEIQMLNKYFQNQDIARYIDQEYYDLIIPKFLSLTKDVKELIISELFYQAMQFLINVNQLNQVVNKIKVKQDMIFLQQYWEYVYVQQESNLEESINYIEFFTKEVKNFSVRILNNPIRVVKGIVSCSVQSMLKIMGVISEQAFINALANKITLTKMYPIKDLGFNFDKHDIDCLLKCQVEKIVQQYGYKFWNVLDTAKYVSGIHEHYIRSIRILSALFDNEAEIYLRIEEMLEGRLLPYQESILLGHLTQLFPLLEIHIRELGKIFGIVPFKETKNEFMKFKDPSSILQDLIGGVYQELDSFEGAEDLLFVYHFMYNSNSLNIRNECIHGRDYTEGESLKFAFKLTLLSLYMILYKKSLILKNIENNKEDKKSIK